MRFYETMGFNLYPLGDNLAHVGLGSYAFLLQGSYIGEWAENMMMHVLVDNLALWWQHIDSLSLATPFDVPAPAAPKLQPWV